MGKIPADDSLYHGGQTSFTPRLHISKSKTTTDNACGETAQAEVVQSKRARAKQLLQRFGRSEKNSPVVSEPTVASLPSSQQVLHHSNAQRQSAERTIQASATSVSSPSIRVSCVQLPIAAAKVGQGAQKVKHEVDQPRVGLRQKGHYRVAQPEIAIDDDTSPFEGIVVRIPQVGPLVGLRRNNTVLVRSIPRNSEVVQSQTIRNNIDIEGFRNPARVKEFVQAAAVPPPDLWTRGPRPIKTLSARIPMDRDFAPRTTMQEAVPPQHAAILAILLAISIFVRYPRAHQADRLIADEDHPSLYVPGEVFELDEQVLDAWADPSFFATSAQGDIALQRLVLSAPAQDARSMQPENHTPQHGLLQSLSLDRSSVNEQDKAAFISADVGAGGAQDDRESIRENDDLHESQEQSRAEETKNLKDTHEAKVQALQRQISEARAKVGNLEEHLVFERCAKEASYREEIRLTLEVDRLERQIADIGEAAENADGLNTQLRSVIEELEQQRDAAGEENDQLRETNAKQAQQINALIDDLTVKSAEDPLPEDPNDWPTESLVKRNEVKDLRQAFEMSQQACVRYTTQIKELDAEIEELQKDLSTTDREKRAFEDELIESKKARKMVHERAAAEAALFPLLRRQYEEPTQADLELHDAIECTVRNLEALDVATHQKAGEIVTLKATIRHTERRHDEQTASLKKEILDLELRVRESEIEPVRISVLQEQLEKAEERLMAQAQLTKEAEHACHMWRRQVLERAYGEDHDISVAELEAEMEKTKERAETLHQHIVRQGLLIQS